MRFIRSILFLALPFLALSKARPQPEEQEKDVLSLEEVVRWIPEESVKAALRDHLEPKYRDGVFEHDKHAIKAVHNADPLLAAKVVDDALHREIDKQELRKRQQDNNTTTSQGECLFLKRKCGV